jgi:hypothetical protein
MVAALFVTVLAVVATAQRPVITPVSDVEHYIPASGNLEYSFTSNVEQLFPSPVFPDSAHWSVAGDLQIVSGQNSPTVTIRSVSRNINYNKDGYGKGRLYLHYGRGDCGWQSVSYDLYKIFTPPAKYGIVGPECLLVGEEVVFSYEPVVTVNPNAYIGTDGYKWDFGNMDIDSILYFSGDSSAVTLRVNSVSDSDNIGIHIGRANFDDPAKRVTLNFSRKAPAPDLGSEMLCVPSGKDTTITLSVLNSVEGVNYRWFVPSDYTLTTNTGPTVQLTLDEVSSGTVTVMASYGEISADTDATNDCSVSSAMIDIKRSFGENAEIEPADENTGSCVAVVYGDNYYTYTVSEAPSNSHFNWNLPQNWEWKPNTDQHGRKIAIRPLSNAKLVDTLKVTLNPCGDKTLKYVVRVKPGRVAINGDPCVERGDTVTFSAVAGAPATQNYVWEVPTNLGWSILSGQGTGEVNVIVSKNYAGAVKVTPQGIGGCNGETVELATQFRPTKPNGIIMPGNCINAGMPDTVVFSVDGLTNQLYAWNIGELGTIIGDATGATIQVETSGIDGSYPVSVRALGSGSSCGNSSAVTDTVTIDGEEFELLIATYSVPLPGFPSSYACYIPEGLNSAWLSEHSILWLNGSQNIAGALPYITALQTSPDVFYSPDFSVTVTNILTGCVTRKRLESSPSSAPARSKAAKNSVSVNHTLPVVPVQFDFTMSPNPAKSTVNVNFTGNLMGNMSLSLYSISGTLVNSWNNVATPNASLDISGINAGNYILVATQNNSYAYKQLVIQ